MDVLIKLHAEKFLDEVVPYFPTNQVPISVSQGTQTSPWDMSCRSTPCKRWRTGEVTCKRGRACPTPAWHCPNKPSESTKRCCGHGLCRRPSKVQAADGQCSLHLLRLSSAAPLPSSHLSSPSPSWSFESYARALLTLNTDFQVRAESAVKQTACRSTVDGCSEHREALGGWATGEADMSHYSFILRKALSWEDSREEA